MIIEEKQSPFFRLSVLICAALELAEEGGHSLQAVSTHSYYIELLFKKRLRTLNLLITELISNRYFHHYYCSSCTYILDFRNYFAKMVEKEVCGNFYI